MENDYSREISQKQFYSFNSNRFGKFNKKTCF